MKIGIIGAGNIGGTLVKRLSAAGHEVKVANSRGPETIDKELLSSGARAVTVAEALADVEVAILSIPMKRIPDIASALVALPEETVVIDTSNYYPQPDWKIDAVEAGQVEALWVAERLGRPVVKAWNAIRATPFAQTGQPAGTANRIAIPVAGDRQRDRDIAMTLVRDSGLDAFDAGSLAESWRQQPGAPAYCTELRLDDIGAAWAAAQKDRLPARRDLANAVLQERFQHPSPAPTDDLILRVLRATSL